MQAFKQPFKQTFWTLTSVLFFPIALLVMVILLPWILLSGIRTGMELIGVPLPTPSEDLTCEPNRLQINASTCKLSHVMDLRSGPHELAYDQEDDSASTPMDDRRRVCHIRTGREL